MQRLKEISPPPSPTTTVFTQSSSHRCQASPLVKRFNRSNSHSRSKSKEEPKSPNHHPPFYVKNICQQLLVNNKDTDNIINKFKQSTKYNYPKVKRESTPAKDLRMANKKANANLNSEPNVEKQLEMLKIQKELQKVSRHNQDLWRMNQELQNKVKSLQQKLDQKDSQIEQFKEHVKQFDLREKQKGASLSNLSKLKKAITAQKENESFQSVQIVEQKNRELQSDNNILRQKLQEVEKKHQQHQVASQKLTDERESFLDELVQQLKIQLAEKDEQIQRMGIQLNIHQVREVKIIERKQAQKMGEKDTLRRKYSRVLQMYHEANQQLKAYKRKSERANYLLPTAGKTRDRSIDSLSLSP